MRLTTVENSLPYWVAFNDVLADKLSLARKLIASFPSLRGIFAAGQAALTEAGLDEKSAAALTSPGLLDRADREVERIAKKGYFILTIEDPIYPPRLREIFDPPLVLYCAGSPAILQEPSVSIVGARKAGPYGFAAAERLAADLASAGVVVVSGMAKGIDSAAHWGALRKGRTVAVLGSGLENIYPRENRLLFDRIVESGAVVSEFPMRSDPLGFRFPLRNRVISGLSLALVVVEATKKSGSLISARLALEQNREVMAVPGNVSSELSRGTNWLIKNGAKLVQTWRDVVEEFPPPHREACLRKGPGTSEPAPELDPREREIVDRLKTDRLTHVDELVEASDLSVSEILSVLLGLEIKNLIVQHPGKYFQRKM